MVARGDLGVEVSFDRVPLIQKVIVDKCVSHAKPVIIATQMMESMMTNFTPTRAEANDVANAVLDGADALMLSGETSIGKYPVETIYSMQRIISVTETRGKSLNRIHPLVEQSSEFEADSICHNATLMAKQTKAKAIVAFTHSGYTAYRLASYRPDTDIFVFTDNKGMLRKLSLVWGVRGFYVSNYESLLEAYAESIEKLKEQNLVRQGDLLLHVGSLPLHLRGMANLLKLTRL